MKKYGSSPEIQEFFTDFCGLMGEYSIYHCFLCFLGFILIIFFTMVVTDTFSYSFHFWPDFFSDKLINCDLDLYTTLTLKGFITETNKKGEVPNK